MGAYLHKFVNRYGSQLCAFVLVAASMTTNICRWCFYQPQEPEGLSEFVNSKEK